WWQEGLPLPWCESFTSSLYAFVGALAGTEVTNLLFYISSPPLGGSSEFFMPLFQQAVFLTTVANLRDLPQDSVREVAFAGRSNAGKSSAINTLAGRV